jgi:2-oxoisovalerate dehydrogenase E2 component (dihydrolipoyl transacylase)
MADVKEFKLPDVGEGLTEAEIVSWKVKPGDAVKVNDIVVEIETAKSLVELPCPFGGTVSELMVPEGETVAVGTPIISVATGAGAAAGGATAEAAEAAEAATPSAEPGPSEVTTPPADEAIEPGLIGGPAPGGRTSVLVGYGPRTTEAKRRPRKGTGAPASASSETVREDVQAAFSTAQQQSPAIAAEVAEPAAPTVPAGQAGPTPIRALAKPPVRKLAKELGVDLHTVTPSGPGGVVTRADVEAHANGAVAAPAAGASAPAAGVRETRVPIKGVRKVTAEAMVSSAFTAPHVTEWVTIDVSRTMRFVKRVRGQSDFRDIKVSPLLVIAKAVCLAVRRTPEINATWDEAAGEIVHKHYVNLGIAAATPRGLVVPNIKDADRMSLRELADALGGLIATARAGKTQPAEMSGGTFTITNVGVFGVDAGTPILNPGQTGILAVGAIRKQPWVVGSRVRPRDVTTLALSFDHRVVDGEQGSRFLADVAALLEDPAAALLY